MYFFPSLYPDRTPRTTGNNEALKQPKTTSFVRNYSFLMWIYICTVIGKVTVVGGDGGQEIHSYLDGKLALGEVDVALLGLLQYAGLVLG